MNPKTTARAKVKQEKKKVSVTETVATGIKTMLKIRKKSEKYFHFLQKIFSFLQKNILVLK
ncbi:MAG: hypothetical protein GY822_00090 [Deltaproteobacteria bacterium]|nr:hypothetical protein [Deltaproteobacteria bacterium]